MRVINRFMKYKEPSINQIQFYKKISSQELPDLISMETASNLIKQALKDKTFGISNPVHSKTGSRVKMIS